LTEPADYHGMAAMISTTQGPTGGIAHAMHLPVEGQTRREGPASIEPEEAARELDAEVTRLLRVRGGGLAEPLLWRRPSHRREMDDVVAHLAPIRSRIALLSSWERESHRSSAVRLAYAIVWLRLAQRRAGEFGPRTSRAVRTRIVTAPG